VESEEIQLVEKDDGETDEEKVHEKEGFVLNFLGTFRDFVESLQSEPQVLEVFETGEKYRCETEKNHSAVEVGNEFCLKNDELGIDQSDQQQEKIENCLVLCTSQCLLAT
jgi:hypothetical protein